MNRIASTIAALALAAGAALVGAPAHGATTFMERTEFDQISAGQSKSKVEGVICNCSGQKSVWYDDLNGNRYWYWWYASHVGSTYIGYRWNGSQWIVGDLKYWCVDPYGNGGIPEGSCSHYQT